MVHLHQHQAKANTLTCNNMRKLLLFISVIAFSSCEEKPVCLKCEAWGQPTYEFCDGEHGVDASVIGYTLTQQGYYCEQQ